MVGITKILPIHQQAILELRAKNVSTKRISEMLQLSRMSVTRFLISHDKRKQPISRSPLLLSQQDTRNPLNRFLEQAKGLNFSDFWDLLGQPMRFNKPMGVLSYEARLTQLLEQSKHILVVKPVSSGITEYFLRWILFKVMTSNDLQSSQVCVIVGPVVTLAYRILQRIRKILQVHDIFFDSGRSYLELNGVEILSVPAHNLDSLRSLENPSIIYTSEADFMPGQISDVRGLAERYIAKSNPWVIYESTIGSPNGLLSEIWHEEPSIYQKIKIDWQEVLKEGMYNEAMLNKQRSSRSYGREILCDFSAAQVGTTFTAESVDAASRNYNPSFQVDSYSLGVDSGWQPSFTGICLLASNSQGYMQIQIAEEYAESEDDIVSLIVNLNNNFGLRNIFIDASDKRFIKRVKEALGERSDFEEYIKFLKLNKILSQYNPLKNMMHVIPVLFSDNSNREMLSYLRLVLEQRRIAIPSNCTKLQNALYNCQDVEGHVLKHQIARGGGADILDACRMVVYSVDN